jgi:hypothetical protein
MHGVKPIATGSLHIVHPHLVVVIRRVHSLILAIKCPATPRLYATALDHVHLATVFILHWPRGLRAPAEHAMVLEPVS